MREVMLTFHFLGLAMGLGTGFAHAFLGKATKNMTQDEVIKFRLNTLVLSTMGHVGIGLLLISGFALLTPYWKVLTDMPWLIVKLALVLMLVVVIGMLGVAAKKAKQGDVTQFKKMASMGKITLLLGIAIVVIAVTVFK